MKNRKHIMFIFLVLFGNIFLVSLISLANAVAQVTILSYSGYVDSLGWYTIVGEVQNNGDMHLKYIRITATFYDSVNNVVGVGTGYVKLGVLLHGRKSPFEIRLTDADQSAKVDHYSLTTSYDISECGKPEGLEILSSSSCVDTFGWMHVSGEIKNIGACATMCVKVIATFYDSAGRVVDCDSTYSEPHDLEVNQTGSFDFLRTQAEGFGRG